MNLIKISNKNYKKKIALFDSKFIWPVNFPLNSAFGIRSGRRHDGVDIRENVKIEAVEPGPVIVLEGGERIAGSHLLVAAGRKANVERLNLDAAGIEHSGKGIQVDARLRSRSTMSLSVMASPAAFPAVVHALGGSPVHIITSNDYLAARDADLLAIPLSRAEHDLG